MSELQAEIVIRLMSDGKVMCKYSEVGPMFLYGMLGNARDIIQARYAMKPSVIAPVSQLPADFNPMRIKTEDIPPMMGNGK